MLSPTSPSFDSRKSPGFGSFDEQDPILILDMQNQRIQSCLDSVHYYLMHVHPISKDATESLKTKGSILNSPSNTETVQELAKQLMEIPSLDRFRRTPLIDSLTKARISIEAETP